MQSKGNTMKNIALFILLLFTGNVNAGMDVATYQKLKAQSSNSKEASFALTLYAGGLMEGLGMLAGTDKNIFCIPSDINVSPKQFQEWIDNELKRNAKKYKHDNPLMTSVGVIVFHNKYPCR